MEASHPEGGGLGHHGGENPGSASGETGQISEEVPVIPAVDLTEARTGPPQPVGVVEPANQGYGPVRTRAPPPFAERSMPIPGYGSNNRRGAAQVQMRPRDAHTWMVCNSEELSEQEASSKMVVEKSA